MEYVVLIIFWLGCGALSFGLMNAYWERAFPNIKASFIFGINEEILMAITGPIGATVALSFIFGFSRYGYQGFSFNTAWWNDPKRW